MKFRKREHFFFIQKRKSPFPCLLFVVARDDSSINIGKLWNKEKLSKAFSNFFFIVRNKYGSIWCCSSCNQSTTRCYSSKSYDESWCKKNILSIVSYSHHILFRHYWMYQILILPTMILIHYMQKFLVMISIEEKLNDKIVFLFRIIYLFWRTGICLECWSI